ncbi:MAG: GNAT family N-acetyltransferase [Ginsengibacter sp.]
MIQLEKFEIINCKKLISWIDNAETLMQFAGPSFSFPLTREQLENSLSDKNRFAFQALETNAKAMIGYGEIYLREKSAFLGRIIIGDKKFRGKGFGQVIVNQLIDFAFNTLNQPKIELNVFEWNTPAINCYKRVGFAFNPVKKSERKVNRKTWVVLNMLLKKSDS